jgi:hypothetical protein
MAEYLSREPPKESPAEALAGPIAILGMRHRRGEGADVQQNTMRLNAIAMAARIAANLL